MTAALALLLGMSLPWPGPAPELVRGPGGVATHDGAAALPWGPSGHRMVAWIAYRRLDPGAREAVDRLLGPGAPSIARAATWPDDLRPDSTWEKSLQWHFMSVEDGEPFGDLIRPVSQIDSVDNVARAIEFFTAVLEGRADEVAQFERFVQQNGARPYRGSTDAAALAFLVHLVGDVHQPLHVGRAADRGGNTIDVNWMDEPTNLHDVWDNELIDSQKLSFSEYADMLPAPAPEAARRWAGDSLSTWIREAVALRPLVYAITARDVPRDVPRDFVLPERYRNPFPYLGYEYLFHTRSAMEERLVKGGIRLAARLNAIFR